MNYSSLQVARQCLRKYKYQCIDKLKPEQADSGDLHFGTGMHTGLQTLVEGEGLEAALQSFRAYWDTLKDREVEYGRMGWSQLADLGELFLTRFESRHLKHITPSIVEERMYGQIGGHDVEGTADVIGLYKGIPSIIDFKTAGSEYPKEKIITSPQMYMYRELARQTKSFEAEQLVYLVFIKGEKRIQTLVHTVQELEHEAHLKDAVEMIEDLKKRSTFPRNPEGCMRGSIRCPFMSKCFPEYGGNDASG